MQRSSRSQGLKVRPNDRSERQISVGTFHRERRPGQNHHHPVDLGQVMDDPEAGHQSQLGNQSEVRGGLGVSRGACECVIRCVRLTLVCVCEAEEVPQPATQGSRTPRLSSLRLGFPLATARLPECHPSTHCDYAELLRLLK